MSLTRFHGSSSEMDNAYRDWRDANPYGYVFHQSKADSGMLHTCKCGHMDYKSNDAARMTKKPKICSTKRIEILGWLKDLKMDYSECSTCRP